MERGPSTTSAHKIDGFLRCLQRPAPAEKADDFDLGLSDLSGSGSDSDASIGNSGSDSNSNSDGEQNGGEDGKPRTAGTSSRVLALFFLSFFSARIASCGWITAVYIYIYIYSDWQERCQFGGYLSTDHTPPTVSLLSCAPGDAGGGGGGNSGISFVDYLNLQKSLRRVTQQKIELNDSNRDLAEKLRKSDYELKRAAETNRRQIAILNKAQKNQMEDHSSIIDSLKLVVEEMEEAANGGQTGKTQGIRQLVDTMKRISDERRELEVAAKSSESTVAQMEQDKLEMITVSAEKEIGMKNELAELRGTCCPIPCCGPGI